MVVVRGLVVMMVVRIGVRVLWGGDDGMVVRIGMVMVRVLVVVMVVVRGLVVMMVVRIGVRGRGMVMVMMVVVRGLRVMMGW